MEHTYIKLMKSETFRTKEVWETFFQELFQKLISYSFEFTTSEKFDSSRLHDEDYYESLLKKFTDEEIMIEVSRSMAVRASISTLDDLFHTFLTYTNDKDTIVYLKIPNYNVESVINCLKKYMDIQFLTTETLQTVKELFQNRFVWYVN